MFKQELERFFDEFRDGKVEELEGHASAWPFCRFRRVFNGNS